MFFNQDVLFKNGPLAIIWLAGNDELRSKDNRKRRNHQYQLMLNSDISKLCDLVRKHFPEMGTENGMSLKKVATLMKGLGFIYLSKMDNLAKNISDMHIRLQVRTVGRLREIDLPVAPRATNLLPRTEMERVEGFGELGDVEFGFGELEFGEPFDNGRVTPRARHTSGIVDDYPAMVMTPSRDEVTDENDADEARKGRKRKRDKGGSKDTLNEETVLQMLRDTIDLNPRAHCLPEADFLPHAPPDNMGFFEDDNFADGTLFRNMETNSNTGDAVTFHPEQPPLDMITPQEGLGSPPGRRSTSGENGADRKRRRSRSMEEEVPTSTTQIDSDQDISRLQLESLEPDGVIIHWRGKRRSKRLIIDEMTVIPPEQMSYQMQTQKRPLDHDEMRKTLANNFAPGKRDAVRVTQGLSWMNKQGRQRAGRQLTDFFNARLKDAKKPRESERQREQESQLSEQIGQSRSGQGVTFQRVDITGLGDHSEPHLQSRGPLESVSIPNISEAGGEALGPDEVFPRETTVEQPEDIQHEFQNEDLNFNVGENYHFEAIQEDQMSDIRSNRLEVDELQEGQKTFKTMFPPGKCSRRRAAAGFFQLLRLKAKNLVELDQLEPYGEIIVRQVGVQ